MRRHKRRRLDWMDAWGFKGMKDGRHLFVPLLLLLPEFSIIFYNLFFYYLLCFLPISRIPTFFSSFLYL